MKNIKKILFIITLCVIFLPFKSVSAQTNYTYAYINATELGPRTCPSTSCGRVISDENRTIWLYRPRVVEVIGYSGEWAKIRWNWYGFTYEGYILQKYLGNKKEVVLDENYKNTLRSKGFPESYVDSLTKMHMIHPNWNFEVSNTGASLDSVVEYEYSPIYKNLISTSNTNQLSTDGAAYANGSYIQFEPGWYAPNKQTLKYYLDPRNFLDDNSIFMFEQLSNNSSLKESDVQKVLNGTFLSGSYTYNGITKTYASTFLQAGNEYNVNPIHLAARVLQEQGQSGSATAVMSYNGQNYYNYFNFNASGSTSSQIISNALNYAVNHGWNNPYQAIRGGASGIANGYISNNQDTLFYQKFNLVGNSSRYSHQYMANIQAPYNESYKTFKSYSEAGLVDTAFTFKIPVYSDMPKATVISTKSNNNNLSKLSVSNCALTPSFDSAITSYACTVNDSVSEVNISATKADSKATVTGDGNKTLTLGNNKIEIKVTAEDGTSKTYTININKIKTTSATPSDIVSGVGLNNNNDNISGFKVGVDAKDVIKTIKDNYASATIKIYNSNNKEITTGIIATGQKIVITNNTTKTFNIIVKGDTNGDGKIGIGDYAKINDSILGKTSLSGSYSLAADTNNDGKIGIGDYAKVKDYILGKISSIE